MSKLRWYNSIRFKMPIVLLLIIVIPILTFWQFNYNALLDNVKESSAKIIEAKLANISLHIEYVMDNIIDFVYENYSGIESETLIKNYIDSTGAERSLQRSKLTLYAFTSAVKIVLLILFIFGGGQR